MRKEQSMPVRFCILLLSYMLCSCSPSGSKTNVDGSSFRVDLHTYNYRSYDQAMTFSFGRNNLAEIFQAQINPQLPYFIKEEYYRRSIDPEITNSGLASWMIYISGHLNLTFRLMNDFSIIFTESHTDSVVGYISQVMPVNQDKLREGYIVKGGDIYKLLRPKQPGYSKNYDIYVFHNKSLISKRLYTTFKYSNSNVELPEDLFENSFCLDAYVEDYKSAQNAKSLDDGTPNLHQTPFTCDEYVCIAPSQEVYMLPKHVSYYVPEQILLFQNTILNYFDIIIYDTTNKEVVIHIKQSKHVADVNPETDYYLGLESISQILNCLECDIYVFRNDTLLCKSPFNPYLY